MTGCLVTGIRPWEGEAGYASVGSREPSHCEIRDLEILDPFYTYCANHPHQSPERCRVPVGPVFVDRGEGREIWRNSLDTEDVRMSLLDLLAGIKERPEEEYPVCIETRWLCGKLGEFREQRAVRDLERITNFDPRPSTGEPLRRSRGSLVKAAENALMKISGEAIA